VSNLFDLDECLSPRLQWMRKHGIRTYHNPKMSIPWMAIENETEERGASLCRTERGDSMESALVALARKMGIRLWNEEGI